MLPVGFGSSGEVDTGDIGHSLRLRSAASAYLSKTFGTAGDRKKHTFSIWCKKAKVGLGTAQYLFCANTAPTYNNFGFPGNDPILAYNSVASVNSGSRTSNALYRDPTSWNHFLLVIDSANATAEDRMQIWQNGVRVTSWSANTAMALNAVTQFNAAVAHQIGAFGGGELFDGYIARVCFVDGQALTPSDFGYQNAEINEWVTKSQSAVKAVVDAGGTNSFMLDFDNGTSLTTLGYDKSSKGNNWTLNNFSLTAGVTYDWMEDVPGNSFAVCSPLETSAPTLSWGNLRISSSGTDGSRRSTIKLPSDVLIYVEATALTGTNGSIAVALGLMPATTSLTVTPYNLAAAWDFYSSNASYINRNGTPSAAIASGIVTAGQVLQLAYDPINGRAWFGKNNVWTGAGTASDGNPSAGTNPTVSSLPADLFVFAAAGNNSLDVNFGQRPFAYAPPTGFLALCQANRAEGAVRNPKLHMDVLLHTGGASSAQNVTGSQFQPDFAWIKSRSAAYSHGLFDVIRGATAYLASDLTAAESVRNGQAFLSNGFTVDRQSGTETNTNGVTYVDWLWKAGGAPVANNAGSISSQVSANVTAGFSIVTYTGTGANATVGHGLGVAPKLVIVKRRAGATGDWCVWNQAAALTGSDKVLFLNTTDAATVSATVFNSSSPTGTVINLGTNPAVNTSGSTYVAYCFAEIPGYSKIGSYTGNGSADGAYIDCGFKPRWVLIKSSTAATGWHIFDTTRSTYNVAALNLAPESSAAESTITGIDFTSQGFKLRTITTDPNAAQTYIFMAIAEVCGKYSLAR